MPRALNCRLITVRGVSKTVKPEEDWENVDGQLIIASRRKPAPMSKRGYVPWVRGRFKMHHSLAAFLAATAAPPLPPSPPSPPLASPAASAAFARGEPPSAASPLAVAFE